MPYAVASTGAEDQRKGNARGPRIDENSHRGRDFLRPANQSGDHLRHLDAEDHAAGTGDEAARDLHSTEEEATAPIDSSPTSIKRERRHELAALSPNRLPMAPPGSARATPGAKYEADQEADIGKGDTECMAQQRRHCRNALELKGHGGANRKQHGEGKPSVAQGVTPSRIAGSVVQVGGRRYGCQSPQSTGWSLASPRASHRFGSWA